MKTVTDSKAGRITTATMLVALLVACGQVGANTTNAVPAVFSFEAYSDGAQIVGTNGWYGEDGVMVAVATNQPYTGQYPLYNEPHDRIAKLTGTVTNQFDGNGAITNVWMDLLIQPRRWQQEEPPGDIPPDAQAVLFVDTNGYLNALCTFYDVNIPGYTNQWAAFQQISFDTNEWLRLTMAFRYQAAFGESYFQIQVNNSEVMTNAFGQSSPGAYDGDGSWFLCIDQNASEFNAITFSGNSYIDDLVVTNEAPTLAELWTIRIVADEGSTMSPAGPNVLVPDGEDRTFTITADESQGYELTNLWWGEGLGAAVATNAIPVTNVTSMAYSFINVTNDYTIMSETWRPGWQGTQAENGTLLQWLVEHGLDYYATAAEAEQGDDDADDALNWQEYVTGTDPNDDTSYFQILDQGHSPSNYVMYYITTNSGVTIPVDIYRSGDLTDTGAWVEVGTDIPRDPSGTTTWWDVTSPTNEPAFYRPTVEWTTP